MYLKLIDSQAVSSTTSYYSRPVKLNGKHASFSWHVLWTDGASTPTGSFTIWFSNIPDPSTADDTDWIQVPDAQVFENSGTEVTLSGTSGKFGASFDPVPFTWHRIKYTNATGTCTLSAHFQMAVDC